MSRPSRPPHELRLRNHHGRAVCTYRNQLFTFGAWDVSANAPTPESLAAFQKQVGLWLANPEAGLHAPPGGVPLVKVWADWLASGHAPRDRRGENGRCGKALFGTLAEPGPLFGRAAASLTGADVLAWQDGLCGLKLSRYTVKRFVSLLRACLAWGRVKGLVPAEVVADVDLVGPPVAAVAPRRRQAATPRAFAAALRRMSGNARLLLRVAWYTGARPSELCRLAVGGVRTAGVVRPAKGEGVDLVAAGVWAAVLGEHKTAGRGGERCLFFGPRCQRLLLPLLARPPASPLFATRTGSAYTPRVVARAVKLACRRAGVPPVTPYQLRHAVAQRVQGRYSATPGAGVIAAAAVLGHRLPGVTGGYAGADWRTAAAVAAELG